MQPITAFFRSPNGNGSAASASPGLAPAGKRPKVGGSSVSSHVSALLSSGSDGSDAKANDGGDNDDVATLTCLPLQQEDQPYAQWIIRVKNAAGKVGFLCRCCRASHPPGICSSRHTETAVLFR
jgi:hypothetical protein